MNPVCVTQTQLFMFVVLEVRTFHAGMQLNKFLTEDKQPAT